MCSIPDPSGVPLGTVFSISVVFEVLSCFCSGHLFKAPFERCFVSLVTTPSKLEDHGFDNTTVFSVLTGAPELPEAVPKGYPMGRLSEALGVVGRHF